MKKNIVLLLMTLISVLTVSAQKKIMENMRADAESFKEKPLAVVLKNEKKEHDKLFNKYLKEAINSEWNLNENIEFVTEEQFKSMIKDKNSNYAYIRYNDNTLKNENFQDIQDQNTFNEAFYFGTIEDKKSLIKEPYTLDENMTQVDIFVIIQHARNTIDKLSNYTFKKMSKKDIKDLYLKQAEVSKIIKDKKLYIYKDNLQKGLEDTISSLYKYDYEIVDYEVIETAILNNNKDFYYLTKGAVVNADTGEIVLAFIPPKAGVQVTSPLMAYKTVKLTENDIKNLVMYLN